MKHTPFGLKNNDCTCTHSFTCRICLSESEQGLPQGYRQKPEKEAEQLEESEVR